MRRRRRDETPKAVFAANPGLYGVAPEPTTPPLPRWYRELEREVAPRIDMLPNASVKVCMPFRDAITAGYLVHLPADTRIRIPDIENITAHWQVFPTVGSHTKRQVEGMLPEGAYPPPMKWESPWHLRLPEGYSALVVHPLNDFTLPFRTLSGIVEFDHYPGQVNFPFVWTGYPGEPIVGTDVILKKGTPIAQIIPFRREEWDFEVRSQTPEEKHAVEIDIVNVHSTRGHYRRTEWVRKVWSRRGRSLSEEP